MLYERRTPFDTRDRETFIGTWVDESGGKTPSITTFFRPKLGFFIVGSGPTVKDLNPSCLDIMVAYM